MDSTDRKIINRIQTHFPIDPRPYRKIGRELNLTEDEVILRVKTLKENGIIRRIGGNFGPYKLGFFSTLCAASVPEDKIDLFTETVNAYTGVTHNYMREHRYNIWFTFIAASREIIEQNLETIARDTGVNDILNLPATDLFKISANFKV
ncbi:transcriptional regulator, AsnC family [Desulfocicer vacuolatum DSM 3385]|uniref:siroheme decarboxylase n=1 Tax=Desulfocicer vacuolatum DSM 3385 TaxID=1121400 RepID=A0A1W1ZNA0_9BACT|nr:AsnC family transcriptional regulator [Desulfocicer vacuolatum]SMC49733.1 transcriptional regulator, AsnC family [Desulfocicer vacuolatum DSM 3385]